MPAIISPKKILSSLNMYRLTIYALVSLVLAAFILSLTGVLPYNPWQIFSSGLALPILCFCFNDLLARLIKTKANPESALITGLILALIAGPVSIFAEWRLIVFLAAASMAAKYVLALRGRHVFNPAALAVTASAVLLNRGASWWVGSAYLLPLVAVFGWSALHKKTARGSLVGAFLGTYLLIAILTSPGLDNLPQLARFVWGILGASPILFFSFVMLPEPQTSPKREKVRVLYGTFTAAALILFQRYLPVSYTLELALLAGNLFAYVVSPSVRTNLILRERQGIAARLYQFKFESQKNFDFLPGQFLEWTVYHPSADSRGIRRYFTIASSPTEARLLLAVKVPPESSTFKRTLSKLEPGGKIIAAGPEGDFILPEDKRKKIAWLAGGIGITPFRSQIKYLSDKNLSRDIVLLYSANSPNEFAFKEIFSEGQDKLGLKIVYTVSDIGQVPPDWRGETGSISAAMIKKQMPDWPERLFYVSGPEPFVEAIVRILRPMGVKRADLKRDYFPGYTEI